MYSSTVEKIHTKMIDNSMQFAEFCLAPATSCLPSGSDEFWACAASTKPEGRRKVRGNLTAEVHMTEEENFSGGLFRVFVALRTLGLAKEEK